MLRDLLADLTMLPAKAIALQISQRAAIIHVLRDGPRTAPELARATGVQAKVCSSYLSKLQAQGFVEVCGTAKVRRCSHCGHTPAGKLAYLYRLKPAAAVRFVSGRPR